jgi:hypothetical protein
LQLDVVIEELSELIKEICKLKRQKAIECVDLHVMEEGNFETIRLPYFGKFHVRPGRVKHINANIAKKNERAAKI